MPNKIVFLADIDLSKSPKTRYEISDDTVLQYAAAYNRKEKLPFPVLFDVDGEYMVGDGVHRISALKLNKTKASTFNVVIGNRMEAITYALQANVQHGLRRSVADRRQCAVTALTLFPKLSNVAISKMCFVGDDLVGDVRKEMESRGMIQKSDVRIDAKGSERPSTTKKHEDKNTVPKAKADKSPDKVLDGTGYEVPEKIVGLWNRRDQAEDLLAHITAIRSRLKLAQEEKDPLFSGCIFSAVHNDLDRVYAGLKMTVPYAVCPRCQGKLSDKCKVCKTTGFVSEFIWKSGVITEAEKALRSKITKAK